MKKEIKNSNNKQTIYKNCCLIVCSAKKKKKKTESKNPKVLRAKNGRIMLLSKCASYV